LIFSFIDVMELGWVHKILGPDDVSMVTRGLKSDLSFVRTVFGGNIAGDEFGYGR